MIGPIMGGVTRLKYSASSVNVVFDGNSLTAGVGGGPYTSYVASMAPLNGVVTVTNCGINGQTTAAMMSASDVDGAWAAGKTNILVAWEGTNSIAGGGSTAQQAATDMASYIAARQGAHPWTVLLLTCLPRQSGAGQQQTTDLNAALDAYNAILRSTYRTMGARMLVDIRASGSPFNLADYQMATFEAAASAANTLWAAGETGQHIHLSNAGYFQVAQMVADALKRLPAR